MWDVLRVSRQDPQLYDYLSRTVGCTGYVKVEWADPGADTTLFQHVGGGVVKGRTAVLDAVKEWIEYAEMSPEARRAYHQAISAKLDREWRENIARCGKPFCQNPGSAESVGASDGGTSAGVWIALAAIAIGAVLVLGGKGRPYEVRVYGTHRKKSTQGAIFDGPNADELAHDYADALRADGFRVRTEVVN